MFDGLTERELLLIFALVWIGAVAIWILLDFLGNNWPKRRFRARGYRIPNSPRRRGEVVSSLRRYRDEEVRETLESATGRPTLALSRTRRKRAEQRRRPSWADNGQSGEATPVPGAPDRPELAPGDDRGRAADAHGDRHPGD